MNDNDHLLYTLNHHMLYSLFSPQDRAKLNRGLKVQQKVVSKLLAEFFPSHVDLYAPKSVELTRLRGKKNLIDFLKEIEEKISS